jgi:hypothetical protein
VGAAVHAQLDERPGIDEQVEALASGQLAGLVLLGDLLLAPAQPDALAALTHLRALTDGGVLDWDTDYGAPPRDPG